MNELSDWLVKHFIEIKGSADTTDSRDQNNYLSSSEEINEITTDKPNNEKTPLEDLKDLINTKIKDELERGSGIDIFHNIFDELVKFVFDNLEIILSKEKITLKEITDIYLSSLYDLEKDKNLKISKFDPYQQFSPETLNYISNLVAKSDYILDFINIEYWEKDIFRNISKVEINNDLLFSIRSLIAFLNLIKNKNKRIKGFKS